MDCKTTYLKRNWVEQMIDDSVFFPWRGARDVYLLVINGEMTASAESMDGGVPETLEEPVLLTICRMPEDWDDSEPWDEEEIKLQNSHELFKKVDEIIKEG